MDKNPTMDRKHTADMLIIWGLCNLLSPFPLLILTAFWTMGVMACFGFNNGSVIALGISMLPLLIHPASSLSALVLAVRRRHMVKKAAWLCMGLSLAGISGNILWLYLLAFLGSIG